MAASPTTRIRLQLSCRVAVTTVHVWGPAGSAAQSGSAIVVHPDLGCFPACRSEARERPARRVSLAEATGRAVGAARIRTARHESAVLLLVMAAVGRRRFDRARRARAVRHLQRRHSSIRSRAGAACHDADRDERGAAGVGDDARVGAACSNRTWRARSITIQWLPVPSSLPGTPIQQR